MSDKATLLLPVIPGSPKEWEADPELVEAAYEQHPTIPGALTQRALAAREQIASNRWFLIRVFKDLVQNDEAGRETYYTSYGVDYPWNGLDEFTAYVLKQLSEGSDPSLPELIESLVGTAQELGQVVEISEARAKELSTQIMLLSRGKDDPWKRAQERRRRESQSREHRLVHHR